MLYLGLILCTSILCYAWLIRTDDPLPIMDAITTGMGLTATVMMALKKVEAWIVWFVDDILMAIVYFSLPNRAMYLMILNIIWIVLAALTFMSWHKASKISKGNGV